MQILRNPRHEKFCELVVSGIKPSEAYISIGYSANGADQAASRLLRRDDVRARISELQAGAHESAVERCVLSRLWVLESLKRVAQRCMQAEPATDPKGKAMGAFTFNAAGANRALELLGRELGLFVERSESKVAWNGDFAKMDSAQRAKLIVWLEEIAFKDNPAGLEEWRRSEPSETM